MHIIAFALSFIAIFISFFNIWIGLSVFALPVICLIISAVTLMARPSRKALALCQHPGARDMMERHYPIIAFPTLAIPAGRTGAVVQLSSIVMAIIAGVYGVWWSLGVLVPVCLIGAWCSGKTAPAVNPSALSPEQTQFLEMAKSAYGMVGVFGRMTGK